MNFKEYQRESREFALYPEEEAIIYPTLGLAGEAGEVAEKIKKWIRDGRLVEEELVKEIGDVLWYVANLCTDLKISMEEVAIKNIEKLSERRERGTIQGEGDDR